VLAALLLAGQPTPVQHLGVGHGTRCPLSGHVEQREHAGEMLDLRRSCSSIFASPRALAWYLHDLRRSEVVVRRKISAQVGYRLDPVFLVRVSWPFCVRW
jgi:hypothetical protein